jgi:hypothetical protein
MKKHTTVFPEYVKERDMGERRAEGNIKVDMEKIGLKMCTR